MHPVTINVLNVFEAAVVVKNWLLPVMLLLVLVILHFLSPGSWLELQSHPPLLFEHLSIF